MSIEKDNPMSDKDQNKPLPDDDNFFGDDFDPSQVEDAGESDEAKKAEAQAKQTTLNLQHRRADTDAMRMEAYGEQDLVTRAKKLSSLGAIKYMHYKPAPGEAGKMGLTVAKAESEMNRLAVFDALFDYGSGIVPYPHRDTFRGRLVDHRGEVLTQKTSMQVETIAAVNAAGLENPAARAVGESYIIWAAQHKRDGLLANFERNMKEWDGNSRLETKLIDLFQPFDTPLTRLVGKYFWLSLYNRITSPGCPAPTSIALIGAQGAGKTRFSRILCETLMDDKNVAPIPLDWSTKDFNNFLRAITGQSIIANVAEMGGLKKADIERMKDFATRDKDELNFKFEDSLIKPRQWIIITDGNTYEGLQRDETGNRRFYPIFLKQLPDENGQPAWAEEFEVDYTNFKEEVWQIMAECRAWMAEKGMTGYYQLVTEVQRGVQSFSRNEMDNNRGTIHNSDIDAYLMKAVVQGDWIPMPTANAYFVKLDSIKNGFRKVMNAPPHGKIIKAELIRRGFAEATKLGRGYKIPYLRNKEDLTYNDDLPTILAHAFLADDNQSTMEEKVTYIRSLINKNDDGDF